MIELLETRIAPAIVFTYTDFDGDRVTVTISKGNPGDATFANVPVPGLFGDQLQLIDLNDNQVFKGANITVQATPQVIAGTARGDGVANVGFIDATGIDLGTVKLAGDLGKILAGDTNLATSGLAALKAGSLGLWSTATGAPNTSSIIEGSLPSVKLNGDLLGVLNADRLGKVKIAGDLDGLLLSSGKLARLDIAGSMGGPGTSPLISVNGNSGRITIAGDLEFGTIQATGNLAGVRIGGTVFGFNIFSSATISSVGDMGLVEIGGNLSASSLITAGGRLAGVTIGGSMLGSAIEFSARILSFGDMGPIKIGGDLAGGSGDQSAQIVSQGKLASVRIGGSMLGGIGDGTAQILSTGDIGRIVIGGSLVGANPPNGGDPSIDGSAYIEGARIGSIVIGGSIKTGLDFNNADAPTNNASIRAKDSIGSITVRGSILGNTNGDDVEVIISARGERGLGLAAKTDVAIGKITVGGEMELVRILAGYNVDLTPANADAQIGTIKVGGDVRSTNIIAGVQDNGDGFGNFNDSKISGMGVKDNADAIGAVSRIAKIIIKGAAIGTLASNDDLLFGIEAQRLGTIRTAGATLPLQPGSGNDLFLNGLPLGSSRTPSGDGFDFHAFEVPAAM